MQGLIGGEEGIAGDEGMPSLARGLEPGERLEGEKWEDAIAKNVMWNATAWCCSVTPSLLAPGFHVDEERRLKTEGASSWVGTLYIYIYT